MRCALAITLCAWAAVCGAADPEPQAPKEVTPLFNGKDLTGWEPFLEDNGDPEKVWTVKDGVLRCEGKPAGYIRTRDAYKDYVLIVEYRWPEDGGNSGVLVHTTGEDVVWPKSIESQLAADNAGDFWMIGGNEIAEHVDKSSRRVPNKTDDSEKPLGEWNTMRIVADGDTITVFVNDEEVNKATQATATGGDICLQSEGTPIEFRRIEIQPLPGE